MADYTCTIRFTNTDKTAVEAAWPPAITPKFTFAAGDRITFTADGLEWRVKYSNTPFLAVGGPMTYSPTDPMPLVVQQPGRLPFRCGIVKTPGSDPIGWGPDQGGGDPPPFPNNTGNRGL